MFTHPSARRYLRYGFWAWTVVASIGATVGGIIGAVEVHTQAILDRDALVRRLAAKEAEIKPLDQATRALVRDGLRPR